MELIKEYKCALCKVDIRSSELVECACGKRYHKNSCAIQAVGKPIRVIDACCGEKRSTRSGDLSLQNLTFAKNDNVESESDSDDSFYQSPNLNSRNRTASGTLFNAITPTTTTPRIFTSVNSTVVSTVS